MKRKKLTKRQLLNELLVAEEAQKKIDASTARLWKREKVLNKKREKLSHELSEILYEERKASGEKKEPIIYKSHMFDISGRTGWGTASCDIAAIKSVK